jgi:hypothetical protein
MDDKNKLGNFTVTIDPNETYKEPTAYDMFLDMYYAVEHEHYQKVADYELMNPTEWQTVLGFRNLFAGSQSPAWIDNYFKNNPKYKIDLCALTVAQIYSPIPLDLLKVCIKFKFQTNHEYFLAHLLPVINFYNAWIIFNELNNDDTIAIEYYSDEYCCKKCEETAKYPIHLNRFSLSDLPPLKECENGINCKTKIRKHIDTK